MSLESVSLFMKFCDEIFFIHKDQRWIIHLAPYSGSEVCFQLCVHNDFLPTSCLMELCSWPSGIICEVCSATLKECAQQLGFEFPQGCHCYAWWVMTWYFKCGSDKVTVVLVILWLGLMKEYLVPWLPCHVWWRSLCIHINMYRASTLSQGYQITRKAINRIDLLHQYLALT